MDHTSKHTVPIMGALVAAGLLIGVSATYGVMSTTAAAQAPPPTTTATETVTQDVAPDTCVQALDAADELLDLHGKVIEVESDVLATTVPDILDAVSTFDVATIEAANVDIADATATVQDLTNQASEVNYAGPAVACRTAAGE